MFVCLVNYVVKRGDLKELKFWAATSGISRYSVVSGFCVFGKGMLVGHVLELCM